MTLNVRKCINYIISIIMIMLLCSFTIFATYSWGRYIMLACIIAIFVFHALGQKLNYKCIIGRCLIMVSTFTFYIFLSSLWAENSNDAIAKGKTLLEILFMGFILYNYYTTNENRERDILNIIKWSGFIIVIYSFTFYGINELFLMSESESGLSNSYANVNTIGMLAAIATLIQLDEIVSEKKFKLAGIFCIPSVFLLALTQSRKALVILLLGSILIFFLRNIEPKKYIKTIFKLIISLLILFVVLRTILSLPIFSGMLNRMDGFLASFTGVGKIDNSTRVRNLMTEIGWTQFLKTPILGMGIGNPHILAAKYAGKDAYLHNNFIELLAGGGIVGFLIYYSMYIYLFINFWRYRKFKNNEYIICFIIMFLLLIMDYGRVSYYSKINYIYLMLYFLEVETLKRKAKQSFQASGRYINNE